MTKKALYIFNPEHDLALASGETNYMAPASARRMASELALLPMWYAEEGSAVLAPSAYNLGYVKKIQELLGLSVDLMTEPELAIEPNLDIRPWGWDVALRKRLSGLGMDEALLPSMEQLDGLREYSHRSKAVSLLPELQLNEYFCGESYYLKTQEEWKTFVEERECCLLKAPLSGSGKGLNWCKGIFTPFISGWCTRVAASQGGIIAEPIYNKVEEKLTRKVLENVEDEISWRQGEFIFDDLPLQEIARELSNSFGATIQIADTTLQNYRITARFRNGEDLTTILSVLHNAGYFNYSQNNKQIIITAKPD